MLTVWVTGPSWWGAETDERVAARNTVGQLDKRHKEIARSVTMCVLHAYGVYVPCKPLLFRVCRARVADPGDRSSPILGISGSSGAIPEFSTILQSK